MKKHIPPITNPRSPLNKRLMAGFTLVELMITIVVLGILLAMGAPSIQETIDKARLTSQTNATLGMLAYARSEGAKRPGTTITLCASNSINTGAPACDTNDWENGWFIMSDLNGNGVLDNAVDEVLRVGERLTGDNTLRTFGFPNQGFVQFDSNGIPGSSGTFVLCDERGITEAKAIIISVIGHVRSAVDEEETPDDIVNNHEGVNVICPAS
jgi:type IV fimbrial biogenesis protein FimT